MDRVKGVLAERRRRWPWFDHAARAYGRFSEVNANRHAAAVTYIGFLSVFPVLALAFAVLGFTLASNPTLMDSVTRAIDGAFPGLVGPGKVIDLNRITRAKAGAGALGLVGLLLTGLGWVQSLRSSVRAMFLREAERGNVVVRKLADVAILVGLGLTLLASILISGAVTGGAGLLLRTVGLQHSLAATALLVVLGYALTLAVDVVVFLYLLYELPRLSGVGWRQALPAAVMGALGFEVLKAIGVWYVSRTTANPLYGTVAVAIGLLVWINLLTRLLLFCATWTATAPAGGAEESPAGGPVSGVRAPGAALPTGRTGRGPLRAVGGLLIGLWWRRRGRR